MVLQILTIPNLEFRVSLNHPLKNKIVNPKPSSYIGVGYSHFRKALHIYMYIYIYTLYMPYNYVLTL